MLETRRFMTAAVIGTACIACAASPNVAAAEPEALAQSSSAGAVVIEVTDRSRGNRPRSTRVVVSLTEHQSSRVRVQSGASTYTIDVSRVRESSTYRFEIARSANESRGRANFTLESSAELKRGKKAVIARVHRSSGVETIVEASLG